MFKLIVICLLVSVLLMMCSCARPNIDEYVHEVRLSDGTRCAVVVRYQKSGGIDCEWQRPIER
jgi:hypothetical protein